MSSKMPAHTQRGHYEPAWLGDSLAALDRDAKKPKGRDGIIALDKNFQWYWHDLKNHSKGGVGFCLHWRHPDLDNYHYIVVGSGKDRHVRHMTKAELKRTDWAAWEVYRWRRHASIHAARPPTYSAMVRKAVRVGVVITAELKSSEFGLRLPAQQMVNAAVKAGHPPYFMALFHSMPKCRQKCEEIVKASHLGIHGQFAVIFGRWQYLRRGMFRAAVKRWNPKPTRVW